MLYVYTILVLHVIHTRTYIFLYNKIISGLCARIALDLFDKSTIIITILALCECWAAAVVYAFTVGPTNFIFLIFIVNIIKSLIKILSQNIISGYILFVRIMLLLLFLPPLPTTIAILPFGHNKMQRIYM